MRKRKEKKSVQHAQQALLTVTQAALVLGVCRQTVYNYIYHEGLPSIVIRGIRRIDPDSLQGWLKQHEQQSA